MSSSTRPGTRLTPSRRASPSCTPVRWRPAHGLDLLADALLIARERDTRLRLAVAGEGSGEPALRRRLGAALTVLGPITPDLLAHVYATADLLVAPSPIDLFGQSVIEAQASGLPVVALDAGVGRELVESGRDGCLVPAVPEALAAAIVGLARRAALCDRLVTGGLVAARRRTSEQSREQLGAAYARALAPEAVLTPATPVEQTPEGILTPAAPVERAPEVARAA